MHTTSSVPTNASTQEPTSAGATDGVALRGRLVGLSVVAAEHTGKQEVRRQQWHAPPVRRMNSRWAAHAEGLAQQAQVRAGMAGAHTSVAVGCAVDEILKGMRALEWPQIFLWRAHT